MGQALEELQRRRNAVLACLVRHHASNPRVFGSVARGEEGPDSDLDLLVTLPREASSFAVVRLGLELEALLERRVDLVVEDELHPALRARVLAEARSL